MNHSPYLYPGLKPPITSCWIIPGYDGNGLHNPYIKSIYSRVLKHFNKHPHQNFKHRHREHVIVRSWTMFIAMCLGYSSSKAALFFNKDHSTALHACNRIIGEIQLYKDSSNVFKHFATIYDMNPKKIQSNTIKQFLTTWKHKQNM